jgi:hypothetical protein
VHVAHERCPAYSGVNLVRNERACLPFVFPKICKLLKPRCDQDMAVPGFSVSELIQALGQAKNVYDAFFNEYKNSASQVKDLADDIEHFRNNLLQHKEIVEQGGIEYSGYEAVQRTLGACYRFLDDYKEVLDPRRRKSFVGALKTARYAFEQDEVNRLRSQIERHKSNIILHSMNVVL